MGSVEVFLREACIISEFGCSLCSFPGSDPMLRHYSVVVPALEEQGEVGWPAGGIIVQKHKQSAGVGKERNRHFCLNLAFSGLVFRA